MIAMNIRLSVIASLLLTSTLLTSSPRRTALYTIPTAVGATGLYLTYKRTQPAPQSEEKPVLFRSGESIFGDPKKMLGYELLTVDGFGIAPEEAPAQTDRLEQILIYNNSI